MQALRAMSCWIANSLCPKSGQTIQSAVRAGIPPERTFATTPQLARQMLERAFDARVPATWVAGDSVYGENRLLRDWLEARSHAYVWAVSGKA